MTVLSTDKIYKIFAANSASSERSPFLEFDVRGDGFGAETADDVIKTVRRRVKHTDCRFDTGRR